MRPAIKVFQLAAPYLAVLVGWVILGNAWIAILLYHAQILAWSRRNFARARRGGSARLFIVCAMPAITVFWMAAALLPLMCEPEQLHTWLQSHGLGGIGMLLMIPYFGLVHPVLEQAHWFGLRRRGWYTHLAFAGYHALVLKSLLPLPWTIFCVTLLIAVSFIWGWLDRRRPAGYAVQAAGHIFADLGIILAAHAMIK